MKTLEKILVPVDLNQPTDSIINNTVSLAKAFNSEVLIITVLPLDAKIKSIEATIKQNVEKRLQELEDYLKRMSIKTAKSQILYGNILDNIIRTSRRENVDLILIESKSFYKKSLSSEIAQLSPVVEKVVRRSDKMVWVTKPFEVLSMNNILCPVDFSRASERALRNSIGLCRKFKSNLIILTVYEPVDKIAPWINIYNNLNEENKQKRQIYTDNLNSLVQKFNLDGIEYKSLVKAGNPIQEIYNMVSTQDADLIVMGTTGKANLGKILLGSTTQTLLRKMPCSIFASKPADHLSLRLEVEIQEIENFTEMARKLEANDYNQEAIVQYEHCLRISAMHIPSYYNIARVYKNLKRIAKAEYYEQLAEEILHRVWDNVKDVEITNSYLKKN